MSSANKSKIKLSPSPWGRVTRATITSDEQGPFYKVCPACATPYFVSHDCSGYTDKIIAFRVKGFRRGVYRRYGKLKEKGDVDDGIRT